MKASVLVRIFALLVVVALAAPAFAKPVNKDFSITRKTRFGGTELAAGQYRLLVDGTKVTVKQGNKVLAEVEGQLEQRAQKATQTSVMQGPNGEVREIRFRGDNRVLVIRGQ